MPSRDPSRTARPAECGPTRGALGLVLGVALGLAACSDPEPRTYVPFVPTLVAMNPLHREGPPWVYAVSLQIPVGYHKIRSSSFLQIWSSYAQRDKMTWGDGSVEEPVVSLAFHDSAMRNEQVDWFKEAKLPCNGAVPVRTVAMPDGYQALCGKSWVIRYIRLDEGLLRCTVRSLHWHSAEARANAWKICASVRISWWYEQPRLLSGNQPTPPRRRGQLEHVDTGDGWTGWRTRVTVVPQTAAQMIRYRAFLVEHHEAAWPDLPGMYLAGPRTARQERRLPFLSGIYYRNLLRALDGLPPEPPLEDPFADHDPP